MIRRLSFALLLSVLAACAPGTEVVVRIDSAGLVAPGDFQTLCITVTNPSLSTEARYRSQDLPVCPPGKSSNCFAFPISVTLTPGAVQPNETVRVQVDALPAGATCEHDLAMAVTSDASIFTFTPGQSQKLDFFLYGSCLNKHCSQTDQACNASGACADLAPYPSYSNGVDAGDPTGGPSLCPGAPPFAFCDGFETDPLSLWDTSSVEPTNLIARDAKMHWRGSGSMRVHMESTGPGYLESRAARPRAGRYLRFFYFLPDGALDGTIAAVLGGNWIISLRNDAGALAVSGNDLGPQFPGLSSSKTLPTNRWNCLELFVDDQAGEVQVWLDDQEITALHATGFTPPVLDTLRLGLALGIQPVGIVQERWYDEVVMDDQRIGCAR